MAKKGVLIFIVSLMIIILIIAGISAYFLMKEKPNPNNCTPNFECTDWSTCSNSLQSRTCTDSNSCNDNTDRPLESQSCTTQCSPDWQIGEWSSCNSGTQTRTVTDLNNCGITNGKPDETQSCTIQCSPNWQCTSWSICTNNQQTRICTDSNYCGTFSGRPSQILNCNSGGKENFLILTTNSLKDSPNLNNLINLRSNYNIIERFVDGMSSSQIKDIINSVNNQNPLTYILIVGSSANIPSDNSGEYYYSDLNGDGSPDVSYGRIPFSNEANLKNLIDKEIQYENSNYYNTKKILFMAGDESPLPEVLDKVGGWQTATLFNDYIEPKMGGWTITKAYYGCSYPECMIPMNTTSGSWGCDIGDSRNVPASQMGECDIKADKETFNKMNDILFMSYTGHGGNSWMPNVYFPTMPTFNFGVVSPYLNNQNKYFILNSFSCSTITLNGDSSISTTPGVGNTGFFTTNLLYYQNYGAVAVIGSAIPMGGLQGYMTKYHQQIQIQKTIGKAWLESDPIQQSIILGDPTLNIN